MRAPPLGLVGPRGKKAHTQELSVFGGVTLGEKITDNSVSKQITDGKAGYRTKRGSFQNYAPISF